MSLIDADSELAEAIRAKTASVIAAQERMFWEEVLKTYSGRAIIWSLLEIAGIYEISYRGDANDTFFREGKRQIGLWALKNIFTAPPELYMTMQREAENREKERNG